MQVVQVVQLVQVVQVVQVVEAVQVVQVVQVVQFVQVVQVVQVVQGDLLSSHVFFQSAVVNLLFWALPSFVCTDGQPSTSVSADRNDLNPFIARDASEV